MREIFKQSKQRERKVSLRQGISKTMCRWRISAMKMRVELADAKEKVQKKSNIKARPNIRLNHNLSFSQPAVWLVWGVYMLRLLNLHDKAKEAKWTISPVNITTSAFFLPMVKIMLTVHRWDWKLWDRHHWWRCLQHLLPLHSLDYCLNVLARRITFIWQMMVSCALEPERQCQINLMNF